MWDDSGFGSGFGGDSFFDTNHDGHIDAFEADHAECFLHDCDNYDQIDYHGGGYSHQSPRTKGKLTFNESGLKAAGCAYLKWLLIIFILQLLAYLFLGVY